jgi:hypothetical protein
MAAPLMDRAAELAAANKITPVTQDFDESKGVEGRTASIASSGSPLMQLAETRGVQGAAKRGLTNSSIGIESAQKAVLDSAVPIATADASLYSQSALANQSAKNSAATANANIGATLGGQAMSLESQQAMQSNDLAQRNKELDVQREQFAQQLGMTSKDLELRRDTLSAQQQQFLQQLDQQKAQLAQEQSQFNASLQANQGNFQSELAQRDRQLTQQAVLAKMDADTRLKLGELDAASRADVQNSANIAQAWGQMMTNVANIQNNPNLEPDAKRTLIENNMQAFQSFSAFWKKLNGGTVDVSDLMDFQIATGAAPAPPSAPTPVGGPAWWQQDPDLNNSSGP